MRQGPDPAAESGASNAWSATERCQTDIAGRPSQETAPHPCGADRIGSRARSRTRAGAPPRSAAAPSPRPIDLPCRSALDGGGSPPADPVSRASSDRGGEASRRRLVPPGLGGAGSGGTRCHRPAPRRPDTAGPSPRGPRGRGSRGACRTRGSRRPAGVSPLVRDEDRPERTRGPTSRPDQHGFPDHAGFRISAA